MKYILIVMFFGKYVETTDFQEFNNLRSCEFVVDRIKIESKNHNSNKIVFCAAKGEEKGYEYAR